MQSKLGIGGVRSTATQCNLLPFSTSSPSPLSNLLLTAALSKPNPSTTSLPFPSISFLPRNRPVPEPLLSHLLSSPSSLPPSTFLSLLNSLIRSSRFHDALSLLSSPLPPFPSPLSASSISSLILSSLSTSNPHLPLALSLFRLLLLSSPDALPSLRACNHLLLALSRSNSVQSFLDVFQKLSQRNLTFSTFTYNICINAFSRFGAQFLPLSLSLFQKMKTSDPPVCPDLCTYNSLLRALCLYGKVENALIVFHDIKASGHEPDVYTYRPLIQGCCKTCRINDALKLFDEMLTRGIRGDTIVYNSLLDGLLKARKLDEACKLFEKMVYEGIPASTYSFNTLIHGLFKNGRLVAGFVLFCELKKKKGTFVDGISYSIVITELCKEGQVEEALELVKEMDERGFIVDLVTVSSLLIGFHKCKRLDLAERLMKNVRYSSVVLSVNRWKESMEAAMRNPPDKGKDYTPLFPFSGSFDDVYNLIRLKIGEDIGGGGASLDKEEVKDEWSPSPYLDKLAQNADSIDNFESVFKIERGKRVHGLGDKTFDVDMVNTYLSIFLSKGKLSIACKLFELFATLQREEGANSYTYNSFMSSFVKKGYLREAWAVLHEMGEKLCPRDIATYNVIIQGLGKLGEAEVASSVLEQLSKEGGYLDIVMYNTLINALGKGGQAEQADKLFEQMVTRGVNPDVVTFNTLIEVNAKAGRVKEAYKYLRKMLLSGLSPNHITDNILDFLEKEIAKQNRNKGPHCEEKV
ncbi:pentatricopeptide repeat-containing protein At4g01570-like [Carex rostrata]